MPKRAVAVVHGYYPADVRVRRAAVALASAGWQVDVICLRKDGEPARETIDGVEVVRLPLDRRRASRVRYALEYAAFLLLAFLTVWRRSQRRRYAIAHVHTLPDFLVFAAAPARWNGAALLLDLHEITPEFYEQKYGVTSRHRTVRMLQRLEQASIGFADAAVTVNDPLRDRFLARGAAPEKLSIVMNTPDEALFPRASAAYVRGSTPADPLTLVYHGSLLPIYGLEVAVRAMATVRARWPYRLLLYGSGEGQARIAEVARSVQCQDVVEFCGTVPNEAMAGVLQTAGGGIVPTLPGPMLDLSLSNKLLEMVCVGCPVIAAALPSYRRYLPDGAVTYFTPGSIDGLAAALDRFAGMTPEERRAQAQRGLDAFAPLAWDGQRRELLRVIDGLVRTQVPIRTVPAPGSRTRS